MNNGAERDRCTVAVKVEWPGRDELEDERCHDDLGRAPFPGEAVIRAPASFAHAREGTAAGEELDDSSRG
jgi:hypothetical protein